jgi:hypothetical protein
MDGPNIERLFTETDCLNAQSNLPEITRYLRFYKSEDAYQIYLKKYLPKLAKPEYKDAFDEFIGDLRDEELAAELKKAFIPAKVKKEVEVVEPITDAVVEKVEPKKLKLKLK